METMSPPTAPMRVQVSEEATDAELHDALRAFTDHLMLEIARLSGRPYLHEYIPVGAGGSSDSSSLRNHPFTQSA